MDEAPPLLNVEYWLRVLYQYLTNREDYSFDGLIATLAHIWEVISYAAYAFSLVLIALLIYVTIKLHHLEEEDEERFATLEPKKAKKEVAHTRLAHVEELMRGLQESDWRQAIIEADIILDDALRARGYVGEGVGERLKQVTVSVLPSLDSVWEAHRVRNRIAHDGSTFKLEERIAHRTIQHYQNAFVELGVI